MANESGPLETFLMDFVAEWYRPKTSAEAEGLLHSFPETLPD